MLLDSFELSIFCTLTVQETYAGLNQQFGTEVQPPSEN